MPAVIISGQYGFRILYITRSLIRLEAILVNLVAVYLLIKLSPWRMVVNILPEAFACVCMSVIAFILLEISDNIIISFLWIAICATVYFIVLLAFPKEKIMLVRIKDHLYTLFKINRFKVLKKNAN